MSTNLNPVIFDIETVPRDHEAMTALVSKRMNQKFRRERINVDRLSSEQYNEYERLVRSVDPLLCRIVAISCYHNGNLWTRTAMHPEAEIVLLRKFWHAVKDIKVKPWVGFNSKSFDAPVLRARCAALGVRPSKNGLFHLSPYYYDRHLDLSTALGNGRFALTDLCAYFGIASPKEEFDGGDVVDMVEAGRGDVLERYVEGDVLKTFECYEKVVHTLYFK